MRDPLAIPLGDNTVYLWERGGTRVLVDAGPDYRGAWESLQAALAGRQPDLVAVSHSHSDHAGLGARWREARVPVAIGAADASAVRGETFGSAEFEALRAYLLGSGAPPEVMGEALAAIEARRARAAAARRPGYGATGPRARHPTALRMDPFEPSLLVEGELALPGGLQAIACPGHTPGNLVFFDPAEGWLFSGDQLLADITPTPALQWQRRRQRATSSEQRAGPLALERLPSLPGFVASLERLRRLGVTRCFPGHGAPFGGVDALIEANLAQVRERTERVRQAAREGRTLWEVCETLYPRAARRRFWQILATVQGHLDLLSAP